MPGAQLNADLWITEYISPNDVYSHGVDTVHYAGRTPYQQVQIVSGGIYGKALVLDGKWQSCEGDEKLYHEPLVHPACLNHGKPRNVLVLGGGEGATIREALKWKSVERVVMVDIDKDVVEACREHLGEMHQGAFDDPRTELVFGDALNYLDEHAGQWDIIISDLTDPLEEGPSFLLFTKEYFEKCKRALAPGGHLVVQSGPVAPPLMTEHARLAHTLKQVFTNTASMITPTAAYGSPWSYIVATDEAITTTPDPAAVDQTLAEKTTGSFYFLDGIALVGLLHPPKYLRDAIAAETQVYTMKEPPKFHGTGVAGTPRMSNPT